MTWMGEDEDREEKKLTPEQRAHLLKYAEHIEETAESLAAEPIDPKVEAMLRMVADLLLEQIQLSKYYPWDYYDCGEHENKNGDEKPNSEYHFLKNKEDLSPSADELADWFGGTGDTDDGDLE